MSVGAKMSSGGEKDQTCRLSRSSVYLEVRTERRAALSWACVKGFSYFHDSPICPTSHNNRLLFLKRHPPNRLGRRTQFAYQLAGLQVPDLDPAVAAAGHDARLVKLQARDAIVVGREPVDRRFFFKRPDAHGAVGAACNEDVAAHLELADERGVALEDGFALSVGVVSCIRHG